MLTLWYNLWMFVGGGLCTDSWIIHICGGVHAIWMCSTQVVWGVASGSVGCCLDTSTCNVYECWLGSLSTRLCLYMSGLALSDLHWTCFVVLLRWWPTVEDHWPRLVSNTIYFSLRVQVRPEPYLKRRNVTCETFRVVNTYWKWNVQRVSSAAVYRYCSSQASVTALALSLWVPSRNPNREKHLIDSILWVKVSDGNCADIHSMVYWGGRSPQWLGVQSLYTPIFVHCMLLNVLIAVCWCAYCSMLMHFVEVFMFCLSE